MAVPAQTAEARWQSSIFHLFVAAFVDAMIMAVADRVAYISCAVEGLHYYAFAKTNLILILVG